MFPGKNYPDERFRNNFRKTLDMYKRHEASMEQIVSYVGHLEYLDGDFFIDELFKDARISFPWIELRDFINEGGPGGNANTEPPGRETPN